MRRKLLFLTLILFATTIQVRTAVQVKVCASGCAFTNSQLQAALDSALPGDEVLLEKAHIYASGTDGYVLGAQCHSTKRRDCIVVRTGVTSAGALMPPSDFPASANTRIIVTQNQCTSATASCRGVFAVILPSVNNSPAIRTIWPGETGATCSSAPCVGDGWTLEWLSVGPKADWAVGPLVAFGTNKVGKEWNNNPACSYPDANPACWSTAMPGGETQDTLVEVPQYLSLLQSDLYGDSFVGQHKGLLLASKDAWVLNNSITDIKSRQESQAIAVINGLGPHDVENNLLEATTENFMTNGSDTYLQLEATITGSPTTTTIALGTPLWMHPELTTSAANLTTDIYNNIYIAIIHGGTTYPGVKCATSAVTSSTATCTLSPALSFTPSAGDVVRWSWTNGGLTFKYNWDLKHAAWMGAAIPAPTGLNLVAGTGGSLTAGSHCYRIYEWALLSGEQDAYSDQSAESCVVTAASGKVTLTWTNEGHATHWWVTGNGTTGTENKFWNVLTNTYVDTGAGGTASGFDPHGLGWLVKNGFETKGCDGNSPMGACLVQGNVIDRNWCCTQNATVTLKILDQDGNDVSNTLRNFTFRDNWIRHGNRCLALVTSSVNTTNDSPSPSGEMTDVLVTNNLCTDIDTIYEYPFAGGTLTNSAMLVTQGSFPTFVGNRGCTRCTVTHNSFFVNGTNMAGPLWFVPRNGSDATRETDFVLRNNIMGRECPAGNCDSSYSSLKVVYNDGGSEASGTTSWNYITTGSSFADHNAWPDGGSGIYTAGPFTSPFFITDATIKSTHLSNYTNCNTDVDILGCALVGGSSMHNAASDGTDVGANVATIKTFSDIALSGNPAGGTPPPSIVPGVPRWRIRIRGGTE